MIILILSRDNPVPNQIPGQSGKGGNMAEDKPKREVEIHFIPNDYVYGY